MARWQDGKTDSMVALGIWLLGEGSISPWERGSGTEKSLVRNTIGNPHCPVLFQTSLFLLWNQMPGWICQIHIPVNLRVTAADTDGTPHKYESLHYRKKIVWDTLWHKQLCMCTVWKDLCESVIFNVWCLKITVLSQDNRGILSVFISGLVLPIYRKRHEKHMRYSLTLRLQFRWLRGRWPRGGVQ